MRFGTAAPSFSEQAPRRAGFAGPTTAGDPAEDEQSWPLPDPGGRSPEAWVVPPDPDCSIGQKLFDARHGVVLVEGVEWRERNGRPTEYVAIGVVGEHLALLVPRDTMGAGALRRLMTYDEAMAVVDELGGEPSAIPPWTSMGFATTRRRVLARNPLVVAAVVRDLAAKGNAKSLGTTDRALFERGATLLAAELGVVLGVGDARARRLMEAAMAARPAPD